MARFVVSLCWLALLCSCHDAPRNNPFDPALTPPVELQVALDDTAGTATLTWTPYQGQQPFREYRVLRNIADRKTVDTLAHIPTVGQTAFVDTALAPSTAYVYRVETLNAGGYAAASQEKGVAGFSVGTVRLLAAETNPRTGTVSLRWHRYVGPDFGGYQVFRRVGETIQEELLATRGPVQDTTLVDTTARADVGYVYRVVAQAAGRELPSNSVETRLLLPPVSLSTPTFDSRTASATLNWTRYQGPRFRAYRVERRSEGVIPQVLKEVANLADTSLVDTRLLGNTEYSYRVVVETWWDEEVFSEEQSGAFHRLVDNWSMPIEDGEYVRLYREGENLTALVAGQHRVRLLFSDPQGALLGEQVLLDAPFLELEPRSVAMAPGGGRERWLSALDRSTGPYKGAARVVLLHFGQDGRLIPQEHEVFPDSLVLSGPGEASVQGKIGLVATEGVNGLDFYIDNVQVSKGGVVLFADDFADGDLEGWKVTASSTLVANGRITGLNGFVSREDASWQNAHLEAEVAVKSGASRGIAGISIGESSSGSYLQLDLWYFAQQAQLTWVFLPPPGSDFKYQSRKFSESLLIIGGLPYRLGLEVSEGRVRATVGMPMAWSVVANEGPGYTSLVSLGDKLALTTGAQPYLINPARHDSLTILPGSPASEMRLWQDSKGEPRLGVCLPEDNLVAIDRSGVSFGTKQLIWPFTTLGFASTVLLGAAGDQEGGELLSPLSFDVGQDGRTFVLSAGNAHIVVFDAKGGYITQWGGRGSRVGEFDFGKKGLAEDFVGSVAVDNEGYIYVADVGNRRIQKFAP